MLINHVIDESNDGKTSSDEQEAAWAMRTDYIDLAYSATKRSVATESMVESSAIAIELLTSSDPATLTKTDTRAVLDVVSSLANSSAALGSVSSTAAASSVSAISNLVDAGVLSTNASSSAGMKDEVAATVSAIETSIKQLNVAITNNMVAGEDPVDINSANLGVTNLVVSPFLLASTAVRVSPVMATEQAADGSYQPSFMLPANLLDSQGLSLQEEETVLGTNWAQNPYEAEGGALQNGTFVTSLNIGSLNISGLDPDEPIVLTLPLPVSLIGTAATDDGTSSRRRRLSEASIVDDAGGDEPTSITINCTNITMHAESIVMSKMDYSRAEYCGFSLYDTSERYVRRFQHSDT